MRQARDFYTSMNGLWASELMAGAQSLVDQIIYAFLGQDWGIFNWMLTGIVSVVQTVAQAMVNVIFPGAPGAIDYLTAAPEALADVAGNIATTLVMMQGQRRYIQYTFIPQVQAYDISVSYTLYYQLRSLAYSLYYGALNALYASVNGLYSYIGQEVSYLTHYLVSVQNALYSYIGQIYNILSGAIAQAVVNANARMDNLNLRMTQYVNSVENELKDSISTLRFEMIAAIAAASALITDVVIPGAFAVFKLEQTAEIAAGMDVLYPIAAAQIDKTALQFALTAPQVAARALDVPPEAVPGIGGMAEALTAATVFATSVQASACAPLFNKLHQFADDTAELDGVVATVILAGMVTAMVAAPEESATAVADVLAGPLNAFGTSALSLIGLG